MNANSMFLAINSEIWRFYGATYEDQSIVILHLKTTALGLVYSSSPIDDEIVLQIIVNDRKLSV